MAGRKREELAQAVRAPGFTPGARDAAGLIDLLATAESDDFARDVERAIVRMGEGAVAAAEERAAIAAKEGDERGHARIVRAMGRVAAEHASEAARGIVLAGLSSKEARVRRAAASAIGRVRADDASIEACLLAAWRAEDRPDTKRAIAEALGKVGGAASLDVLRDVKSEGDAELARIVSLATTRLERTGLREETSSIDPSATPKEPCAISFECRAGIEDILCEELGPTYSPRVGMPGVVDATLRTDLAHALAARTALRVVFRLLSKYSGRGEEVVERAVVAALTSDEAARIFATWGRGPLRYRLAWATGGHRRAAIARIASEVRAKRPELVNDPTSSPWHVVVHETPGQVTVAIEPRAVEDTRFAYRVRDVPAASHPTLAAALARAAGVRDDDVVWDPFVGSGTELIERAKLGPYAQLFGTDTDKRALEAARANLEAAKITRFDLSRFDATTHSPRGVTLILTNPPMGRRVARGELAQLMERFVANAARVLVRGGRLAWLSPSPAFTREALERAHLEVRYARTVDMGGFDAELEVAHKV